MMHSSASRDSTLMNSNPIRAPNTASPDCFGLTFPQGFTLTLLDFEDNGRGVVHDPMKLEKEIVIKENRQLNSLDVSTSRFQELAEAGKELLSQGYHEQTLVYYREALRLKNGTLFAESKHVQAVFADLLFDIGVIQSCQPEKSLQAFHLCLDLRRRCLGNDHPAVGNTLYNLASVYRSIGISSAALDYLTEALSVLLCYDREDCLLFDVWVELGLVQKMLGQIEDATSSFEEACNVLGRMRMIDPIVIASKMAHLMRSRGNFCDTPEELNEAVSFVNSMVEKPTQQGGEDAAANTAVAA